MHQKTDSQPPVLVTVKEARALTGLGNTKLYELIGEKRLKSITVGRRRLVVFASIQDLVNTSAEAV
jgi:excisionase family DNA binding protein